MFSHSLSLFFSHPRPENMQALQRIWIRGAPCYPRRFHVRVGPGKQRCKIGLFHGVGTRFTLFFYAIVRLLRLKAALCAAIHSAKFCDLKLNDRATNTVRDIENSNFWKAIYNLCRAVFPTLHLLCFCDSNGPAMNKAYHLTRRTSIVISRSLDTLNDEELFPCSVSVSSEGLELEVEEVFGEDKFTQSVASDEDDSDGDESGDENSCDDELLDG